MWPGASAPHWSYCEWAGMGQIWAVCGVHWGAWALKVQEVNPYKVVADGNKVASETGLSYLSLQSHISVARKCKFSLWQTVLELVIFSLLDYLYCYMVVTSTCGTPCSDVGVQYSHNHTELTDRGSLHLLPYINTFRSFAKSKFWWGKRSFGSKNWRCLNMKKEAASARRKGEKGERSLRTWDSWKVSAYFAT